MHVRKHVHTDIGVRVCVCMCERETNYQLSTQSPNSKLNSPSSRRDQQPPPRGARASEGERGHPSTMVSSRDVALVQRLCRPPGARAALCPRVYPLADACYILPRRVERGAEEGELGTGREREGKKRWGRERVKERKGKRQRGNERK